MHYHLELLIPPTDDVEAAVKAALEPHGPDTPPLGPEWWDFYKIDQGGHPDWTTGKPEGGVVPLADCPRDLQCHRFAAVLPFGSRSERRAEVKFAVTDELWNGVTWEKTRWNGTVGHGLEMLAEYALHMGPQWLGGSHTPKPDWLVVTVVCHT